MLHTTRSTLLKSSNTPWSRLTCNALPLVHHTNRIIANKGSQSLHFSTPFYTDPISKKNAAQKNQKKTIPGRSSSSIPTASSSADPSPLSNSNSDNSDNNDTNTTKGLIIATLVTGTLAALGWYIYSTGIASSPIFDTLRHFLSSSVLAKSGFFAAFSLIFASEIGDKTFFIAALLAMRCGKWVSFFGSVFALSVMTVISVAIGYAVKSVPSVVKSSEVIGQYVGAVLLVYFGIRTLRDAMTQPDGAEEELVEAKESVAEAETSGSISKKGGSVTPLQAFAEVSSLIFVAEWGDRSMLATIALGAAQSPLGVAGGAVLGHTIATALAVVGGAVLSKYISEKTVGLVGGSLFLVFAAATIFGLF